MPNEIPVFFSIDDAYAPYLATALCSAIKHASPKREYRAIVLYETLSDQNISRISALATNNFHIEFFPIRSGLESIEDRMSNRLRCDYFTLTIYFRIFIPAMFPQYDKGLYIDSDVELCEEVAELFDIYIGDNFLGACREPSVGDVKELCDYMKNAVGVEASDYINSGVLIMNLAALREKKLDEHFLSLLREYHFDSVAPDQDYLNAICRGKILKLGCEWNATPNENHPPLKNPKLVHYNLFSKPWCYDGVQYEQLFWQHAEHSGYIDEIRAHKAAYSEEKKRSDRECLTLMIKRGIEIQNSDITFKKISDSGVKILL